MKWHVTLQVFRDITRAHIQRFPLFFLACFCSLFFWSPSDHRNQSSSERLNTLGWLSRLGETNSIERYESTKNFPTSWFKKRACIRDVGTPFSTMHTYTRDRCISSDRKRYITSPIISIILRYVTDKSRFTVYSERKSWHMNIILWYLTLLYIYTYMFW